MEFVVVLYSYGTSEAESQLLTARAWFNSPLGEQTDGRMNDETFNARGAEKLAALLMSNNNVLKEVTFCSNELAYNN